MILFYILVFQLEGMWDPSSLSKDWTSPPALEGEDLTTGQPGKSLGWYV